MVARCVVLVSVVLGCSGRDTPRPVPVHNTRPAPHALVSDRDKVLAVNGHITVLSHAVPFADHADVVAAARTLAGVTSVERFQFAELIATSPAADRPAEIAVKGIEPAGVMRPILDALMTHGSFASLARGDVVLGDELAAALGVQVGDDIYLQRIALDGWMSPGRPQQFRVGGVFHIDFDEYDRRLAYLSLAAMQALLERDDPLGIEVRVAEPGRAPAIARQLEAALEPGRHEVLDWRELNPGLAR